MFDNKTILMGLLVFFIPLTAHGELPAVAYASADDSQAHAITRDFVLDRNTYEILDENSKMEFRVDSPVGDVWASFREFEGRFTLHNSGVKDYSVSIVIDAGSLDTEAGLIRAMLKGEDFFDVDKYAALRFAGSRFQWINAREGVLKGYLTIKNVTREVAFYVELVDANAGNAFADRVIINATTTIKRSAFGIDNLLPSVGDKVNLFMSLEAQRKNTAVSAR